MRLFPHFPVLLLPLSLSPSLSLSLSLSFFLSLALSIPSMPHTRTHTHARTHARTHTHTHYNDQVPQMIRSCSPMYVKLGLKKHGDIYPSGGHLEGQVRPVLSYLRLFLQYFPLPSPSRPFSSQPTVLAQQCLTNFNVNAAPRRTHTYPHAPKVSSLSRERVRRARIVLDLIERYAPELEMSERGAEGLGIPEL